MPNADEELVACSLGSFDMIGLLSLHFLLCLRGFLAWLAAGECKGIKLKLLGEPYSSQDFALRLRLLSENP